MTVNCQRSLHRDAQLDRKLFPPVKSTTSFFVLAAAALRLRWRIGFGPGGERVCRAFDPGPCGQLEMGPVPGTKLSE